jgi:hypothetical protein
VVKAKETLAIDHSDRLALQHALVMAYQADKQVKKAVELLEHVVAVKGRFLRDTILHGTQPFLKQSSAIFMCASSSSIQKISQPVPNVFGACEERRKNSRRGREMSKIMTSDLHVNFEFRANANAYISVHFRLPSLDI